MQNLRAILWWACTFALGAAGCHHAAGNAAGGEGGATSGSGASAGTGASGGTGGSTAVVPSCSGPVQGGTPITTSLPSLPTLDNVRACTNGGAVNVTFDPLDAAMDYRIYPLPADGDVMVGADGSVVVKNATYRCAGHREALYMLNDIVSPDPGWNDNSAGGTTIQNGNVDGFMRTEADAQLGYVYTTAAPDRIPVYVVASGDAKAEGGLGCGRPVFYSTRPKTYTTDAGVRDMLVAAHGRFDGIGFYVPAAAGAGTRPVYEGAGSNGDTLRWIDGPEAQKRGSGKTLFNVLTSSAPGTVPLMRVHEAPYCTVEHDELVAGMARYKKVRSEGDHPMNALRWAGLTQPTVLVVEALDGGCPYQGNLSPEHEAPYTENFGSMVLMYEGYSTIDDMRKASPTGEVFVNGQYDSAPPPKAIARSFLKVTPGVPASLDFQATFPESSDFRSTFPTMPTGNVYGEHFMSPTYTLSSYNNSHFHFGSMLGELWFAYNDIAADVNGKLRLTPNQKATLSASTYLHVTGEFDILSTARRYPQILISDQAAPVQDALPNGTTLIVQPKDYAPTYLQVQICDHRTWDVNNQCPLLSTFVPSYAPAVVNPAELTATDNAIKLDIFVSTQRIYLMVNDEPYTCTDFPGKADDSKFYSPPSGQVTVTWGDVLYHSAVDFSTGGGDIMGNSYLFHRTHMHKTTRRHFDNIGFASNVAAPSWDETLYPCVKTM
jgi:hypothetical protein